MPPKTRNSSGQQSLKASWTAAKNAKSVVQPVAVKKAPVAVVIKEKEVKVEKKPMKKRKSLTSDDSEVESDLESPADEEEEHAVEVPSQEEEEKPQLDVKDKKVNKHLREVNEKTGYLATIHTEGETKFDKILRVFDLSYEYGPCVGFTRLERWERAKALGLDPPVEVREILLTQQGEEDRYKETVFYHRV